MLLKAEVSKVDYMYSSKAKSCNIRDLLAAKNTVHTCVHEAVTCVCTHARSITACTRAIRYLACYLATVQNVDVTLSF